MSRDWIAMFAGPVAWYVALVAGWMLSPSAHGNGSVTGILVIDAVALVIAVAAGTMALVRLRSLGDDRSGDRRAQHARLIAGAGVALAALSVVLVIGIALPDLLLVPGAEP
jgi:hypothetical protein